MFKFDFNVEPEGESVFKEAEKTNSDEGENSTESIDWYEAEEVKLSVKLTENLDLYRLNATELLVGEVALKYTVTGFLLQSLQEDVKETKDISKAEQTHSDLIPGVYEGGAKVWECTNDLLEYLAEHFKPQWWRDKHVLDLGCGAGLLGLYAFKCGANVQFQDYNRDVLEQITMPNLLLNAEAGSEENVELSSLGARASFYAGDWSKYATLNSATEKFDLILSSETIYNPQNQQKLLDTLHAKLTNEGEVLVAAKTYYFGVGGGLRQFEALVESDRRFQSHVLRHSEVGVGREILQLKRRTNTNKS